jgi:hypothetical protein
MSSVLVNDHPSDIFKTQRFLIKKLVIDANVENIKGRIEKLKRV